ncbi:MAG: hypothetical protein H5T86_13470 [Armatimonadetes bacterium]|nr:hypothetical protein [Armatimonadota bacterium]
MAAVLSYQPIVEQIWDALLDRLKSELPGLCAQAAVPTPAIMLSAGMKIVADTLYLDYAGSRIDGRARQWIDFIYRFDCEIYSFHPSPDQVNRKAMRYEWAVRHALETGTYLDGIVQKVICRDVDAGTLSPISTQPLVHGTLLRIEVLARVPNPEDAQ